MASLFRGSFLGPLLALFLFSGAAEAQKLSPLANPPNWSDLEQFQETITAAEFRKLLSEVYAQGNAAKGLIQIGETEARILKQFGKPEFFSLRFAKSSADERKVNRYWRGAKTLGPAPAKKPLQGLKIALDPGHIGGEWAKIEERWFQFGKTNPVQEGTLTLFVALLSVPLLEAEGAEVFLVRSTEEPVTSRRPAQLIDIAEADLKAKGIQQPRFSYQGYADPNRENSVQWESEKLFYRVSEIRERAAIVNEKIKPDLTICIHFNAEAWGDPTKPALIDANHLHLLINGSYSAGELAYDDVRFDMLVKLLNRSYYEELAASETVAKVFAEETGLPPYQYITPNARRAPSSPYVWTRNLLANRLFECPVIYLEPYVMNSRTVFRRVELGDYPGEMIIDGVWRKSICREYAQALRDGLARYFSEARKLSGTGVN